MLATLLIVVRINGSILYLINRRLDFIGTSAALVDFAGIDPSKALELVFQKIFLPSAPSMETNRVENGEMVTGLKYKTPAPVLVTGTVENWNDQAYLIRRRALYALIQICKCSSKALEPHLDQIVKQVRSRLDSETVCDSR